MGQPDVRRLTFGASPDGGDDRSITRAQSSDCLTWGAVIFKTEVQGHRRRRPARRLGDADSQPRRSERPAAAEPRAPWARPANREGPLRRDRLHEDRRPDDLRRRVQAGALASAHARGAEADGRRVREAPAPISVHFDVGNELSDRADEARPVHHPRRRLPAAATRSTRRSRSARARATDPPWVCQFSEYPGTVGWKTGFRFLRDEVLSVTPTPAPTTPPTPLEDYCDAARLHLRQAIRPQPQGHVPVRACSRTRSGLPKSEEPCLKRDRPCRQRHGPLRAPLRDNPDFHVPRTNTGVGDFPGGDVMVTLGAFADVNGEPSITISTPHPACGRRSRWAPPSCRPRR